MRPANLSICAIVRDESPYIAEWIAYHRLVGVERFYVYDDGSTDETLEILRRMAARARSDIVIIPWGFQLQYRCPLRCTFEATPQITAYNHYVRHYQHESRWTAFIDVDEFLCHTRANNLADALDAEFLSAPAAFILWLIFGSNGHVVRPPGLTIESYTRRGRVGEPSTPQPWGRHGKLIARPGVIDHWGMFGSHNAVMRPPEQYAVNECGRPVAGGGDPNPSAERWRLCHFYHRSATEAAAKVARNDRNAATIYQPDAARLRAYDLNDVEDLCLARYADRVRAALKHDGIAE